MTTIDLTALPDLILESANAIADGQHEVLVGWRAITEEFEPGRTRPVRYQVVTTFVDDPEKRVNGGIYEIDLDGICQRASVLHRFPEEENR